MQLQAIWGTILSKENVSYTTTVSFTASHITGLLIPHLYLHLGPQCPGFTIKSFKMCVASAGHRLVLLWILLFVKEAWTFMTGKRWWSLCLVLPDSEEGRSREKMPSDSNRFTKTTQRSWPEEQSWFQLCLRKEHCVVERLGSQRHLHLSWCPAPTTWSFVNISP